MKVSAASAAKASGREAGPDASACPAGNAATIASSSTEWTAIPSPGPIGGRTEGASEPLVGGGSAQPADAALFEAQRDQGMGLAIVPDDLRHKGVKRGRAGEAEPDPASLAPRGPARGGHRVVDLPQDR